MNNDQRLPNNNVISFLVETGYSPEGAQAVAERLALCITTTRQLFEQWRAGRGLDDAPAIAGYTASRLMVEHGMNPIAAILTMDWLARDPQTATASLARGHDRMITQ